MTNTEIHTILSNIVDKLSEIEESEGWDANSHRGNQLFTIAQKTAALMHEIGADINKNQAVKIELNRAEGINAGEKTFTGPDCWTDAQRQIEEWRQTAPEQIGYDKTDFTVTFEDGATYSGRIDLKHPNHPKPEENNLAEHLANEVLFRAGHRPTWMDQGRYDEIMSWEARSNPNIKEEMADFAQKYHIPSKRMQLVAQD